MAGKLNRKRNLLAQLRLGDGGQKQIRFELNSHKFFLSDSLGRSANGSRRSKFSAKARGKRNVLVSGGNRPVASSSRALRLMISGLTPLYCNTGLSVRSKSISILKGSAAC